MINSSCLNSDTKHGETAIERPSLADSITDTQHSLPMDGSGEALIVRIKQGKCPHPPGSVTADILEGDCDMGVNWCRLCGAYRRFNYHETGGHAIDFGEWREPAIETLKR